MKNLKKIIGIFFVIGFLNILILIEYLKTTNRSGGEVGMIPMVIILVAIISLILATLIVGLLQTKLDLNLNKAILIYHIIYFAIILIFVTDLNTLNDFNAKNIDLFILIIAFFVWIITFTILRIYTKSILKKSKT